MQRLASWDFSHLQKSLDPDQDRQNVVPDLDKNGLTLCICSWNIFFQKVNLEKSHKKTKTLEKLQSMQKVNGRFMSH